ncbi:hypothetical protein IOC61_07150 [Halomonas sp. KAO]|uniref:hypothetical protein n=1 Tax=Halomonas sp. KAO TaxID=2783858 RepID=UPI0018A0FA8F|nr:hypothetical protein [Halomonas sp. KAO]MBF7053098.1 hypothetical protein [Halomonas sp. KAO]
MNQRTAIGLLTAVTGVALLVVVLNHGTHLPAYRWPWEAFQGLVFSFAWGLGVSPVLAYLLAALTFATVFIICFIPGYQVARCFERRS